MDCGRLWWTGDGDSKNIEYAVVEVEKKKVSGMTMEEAIMPVVIVIKIFGNSNGDYGLGAW